jgi:hypothetical protein
LATTVSSTHGDGFARAVSVPAALGVMVGVTGAGVITSNVKDEQATRLTDKRNSAKTFFAFMVSSLMDKVLI